MAPDEDPEDPDPVAAVCLPADIIRPGALPQSRCPIGVDLTHMVQTGQLPLSMSDHRWLLANGIMT